MALSYEDHLVAAYWSVVSNLAPDSLPLEVLAAAQPQFLASLSSGSAAAGRVFCRQLADIEWDWPAWLPFAKSEGADTLNGIAADVARMTPSDLLDTALKVELLALCRLRGIVIPGAAAKPKVIKALALGAGDIDAIVGKLAARLLDKLHAQCRERMAMVIAIRVTSIAYSAHRYQQLGDPAFLAICPSWRFVWGDLYGAPRACRKFDNQVLLAAEARRIFPNLPCGYLHCACHIAAA